MSEKLYNQLNVALRKRQLGKVRTLVLGKVGLAVDHMFVDGSFPLHIAAEENDVEMVRFLLLAGATVDFKNLHGQTPLILGVANYSIVKLLIEFGCKVNLTDGQKRSALHLAASRGLPNVVSLLLKYGARVNGIDKWGRSPLHMTLLNTARCSNQMKKYEEVVKVLLEHNCEVNKQDGHAYTPMFLAVNCGNAEIFSTLVAHGAYTDRVSRHKLTPLMLAVLKGHLKMCRLLLAHNANVNILNSRTGKSCFQVAVEHGHFDIAELLVAAGCQLWKEKWFHDRKISPKISGNPKVMEWLHGLMYVPQSLQQLCRASLRNSMRHKTRSTVEDLCYPERLKNYILLSKECEVLG